MCATPFQRGGFFFAASDQGASDFYHSLGGRQGVVWVNSAVKHHVFYPSTQFFWQVVVDAHHAGIDDAHGHARLDGVV